MFGLVLNALRARRAQTVALFSLTVLAALGAAAAPWFMGWARDTVVEARIDAAPATQRVVDASGAVRYTGDDPTTLHARAGGPHLHRGAEMVVGGALYVNMRPAGRRATRLGRSLPQLPGRRLRQQLQVEGRAPPTAR